MLQFLKACVIGEHVRGQVTRRAGGRADVGHRCHDVATTEVIQLQRTQLTDVPVVQNQQVHAVVDGSPRLVILSATERISEILLGHIGVLSPASSLPCNCMT